MFNKNIYAHLSLNIGYFIQKYKTDRDNGSLKIAPNF